MINVIASIQVKESHISEFIKIFKSNMANVLRETGCIEYVPTIDLPTGLPAQELNSNVVVIIEKWETFESLQAHLIAPHMLEYKKNVKEIVESVSLKILQTV